MSYHETYKKMTIIVVNKYKYEIHSVQNAGTCGIFVEFYSKEEMNKFMTGLIVGEIKEMKSQDCVLFVSTSTIEAYEMKVEI